VYTSREKKMKTAHVVGLLAITFAVGMLTLSCNQTSETGAMGCRTDLDCLNPVKEYCLILDGATTGSCQLRGEPCAACDPLDELCIDQQCVPKWGPCNATIGNDGCFPCQVCDPTLMLCTGEPCLEDGDKDDDIADTTDAADTDDIVVETETPSEESDQDDAVISCSSDSDCPEGHFCGENRTCVPGCTINTSLCADDPGSCNPMNGKCECCDPHCEEGTECNFSGSSWYCGQKCEPPCPDGYACNNGSCIEVRCSTCPAGYVCSRDSCYKCVPDPDGDQDIERRSVPMNQKACLPASSPCVEGVSKCCSGACIMGNCM